MYDPQNDLTAGGGIAEAITNLIAAFDSVNKGASIEVLRTRQEQLAHLINEYIINRIAHK